MTAPARILFTIPNFDTAGSGWAMLNIARRLDRERFSPTICVSRRGGTLCNFVRELDIPLLVSPTTVAARPYLTLPLRVRQGAQSFKNHGFDLWHSFHYADDYTEPLIARAAGARAWVFTKKNMSWGSNAWTLRSSLATAIAAQNRVMLERFFSARTLAQKTTLLERGVETDRYRPAERLYENFRRPRGIPDEAVVCVSVAQLLPRKDHPTILRALAEVPGVHLLLAGSVTDEDYVTALRSLVEELGLASRVYFLGKVTNVPALLAECDIAVLASESEGSPVALLEAMAAGKACITTEVGGCQDIAGDGHALLFPFGDHQALAAHLAALASNPKHRAEIGQRARQRIESAYSIEREVEQHEQLYERALGRR